MSRVWRKFSFGMSFLLQRRLRRATLSNVSESQSVIVENLSSCLSSFLLPKDLHYTPPLCLLVSVQFQNLFEYIFKPFFHFMILIHSYSVYDVKNSKIIKGIFSRRKNFCCTYYQTLTKMKTKH